MAGGNLQSFDDLFLRPFPRLTKSLDGDN
jgi:hypothetical protein